MNLVVTQALASGLPAIVTRHSGLPEQVIDGLNGAVVAPGDPAALAASLVALASQPGRWPILGRAGRAHVQARYDAATLIERQLADYRSLLP